MFEHHPTGETGREGEAVRAVKAGTGDLDDSDPARPMADTLGPARLGMLMIEWTPDPPPEMFER